MLQNANIIHVVLATHLGKLGKVNKKYKYTET